MKHLDEGVLGGQRGQPGDLLGTAREGESGSGWRSKRTLDKAGGSKMTLDNNGLRGLAMYEPIGFVIITSLWSQ